MNKIEIWDKKAKLKGLDPSVWLENHKEAENKTLVLVNDSLVLYLEDIKNQGYIGDTDTAIIEAYLTKQEQLRVEYEQEELRKKQLEKEELEKKFNEEVNKRVEEVKLELSTAITDVVELVTPLITKETV